MDYFLLVASVSLVFQVAVFVLLLSGWTLKKLGRFRAHGVFMLIGVVLHLTVILALMVPSFVAAFVLGFKVNVSVVVGFVHAGLGISAAALGVWLVAGWHLQKSLDYCLPRKRWMKRTLLVWLSALVLGFLLYLSLFWSSLFG